MHPAGTVPWLLTGGSPGWHLAVGDPNAFGWLIFFAYFAAAFACYRAARTSTGEARLRWYWTCVCGAMILLGLNKQLDLQTLLLQTGKQLALAQGWYENRRKVQLAFVAILGVGGALATAVSGYAMRSLIRRVRLSLFGLDVLAAFIVQRAAPLDHVSPVYVGHRVRSVVELMGIVLVGIAARRDSKTGASRA